MDASATIEILRPSPTGAITANKSVFPVLEWRTEVFRLRDGRDNERAWAPETKNRCSPPWLTCWRHFRFPNSSGCFVRGQRLHITAPDPARAETLFSWRDIDNMLSAHALDENVEDYAGRGARPAPFVHIKRRQAVQRPRFPRSTVPGGQRRCEQCPPLNSAARSTFCCYRARNGNLHERERLPELLQGRRFQTALGYHGRPGHTGPRKQAMAHLERGGAKSRREG